MFEQEMKLKNTYACTTELLFSENAKIKKKSSLEREHVYSVCYVCFALAILWAGCAILA